MKRHLLFAFSSCAMLLLSACSNDPKPSEAANANAATTLPMYEPVPVTGADTFYVTEGLVQWLGKKNLGGQHIGSINVKNGFLLINQQQLAGGKVLVDMTSLTVSDIKDPGERRDLESHLKSGDFFEADKYPEASFWIQETLPSQLEAFNTVAVGLLRIKERSHEVNIPVRLRLQGDELEAETPAFMINRTLWDVNFQSTVLGTAKDKLIDDNVSLQLSVKARRLKK